MGRNDKFPFAMTKKSLVVYIASIVLIGPLLFFVRGDMAGKYAACIACPMIIVYLIYAYCKESKADMKAQETKVQYMDGSYFESSEWHEKYVIYLNEHHFEKPKYQSMKMDLLKKISKTGISCQNDIAIVSNVLYLVPYSFRALLYGYYRTLPVRIPVLAGVFTVYRNAGTEVVEG
ncbi:MAG: hypothetical protein ACLR1E_01100 [Coprococcus sp.]